MALESWLRDGLVTPESAKAIRERHGLDLPGRGAGPLLAAVLLGIGGLLIGGGVIALVAANWQEIPAAAKIGGLFVLLLGLHGASFRMLGEGRERLGHGLLLAACVVFGGGIGLMAQVFHISSSNGLAWLLWSAGTLASAWAAGSTPPGLLALGLGAVWYVNYGHETRHYPELVIVSAPYVLLAAFGGLARERGSRIIAGATGVTFVIANALAYGELDPQGPAWVVGLLAGGLLVWAGADWFGPRARVTMRGLGVGVMAFAAYMASFHGIHDRVSARMFDNPAAVGLLAATCALGLVRLALSWRADPPTVARRRVSWLVLGGAAAVAVAYLLPAVFGAGTDVFATMLGNLAVLLIAAAAVASGFSELFRSHFWAGTFLAVLVVLTRFFEYDTDLMMKGFGFISCGVLVMYAGIEYERWLRRCAASDPDAKGADDGHAA